MSSAVVIASAQHETPVFFPMGEETLFGVLTRPPVDPNGIGVVVVQGGSPNIVSFQRNRMAVRLARRVAGLGCHVLRFDYHGVGDSSGRVEMFRLDRPFVEDVKAAVDWIRGQGMDRVIVVGSCFGGRTSLAAATQLEGLAGIAFVAMSISDDLGLLRSDEVKVSTYLRRGLSFEKLRGLLNPVRLRSYSRFVRNKVRANLGRLGQRLRSREPIDPALVSPRVIAQLERLAALRVPTFFLYGTQDPFYRDLCRAREGKLGRILAREADLVEVNAEIEGVVHGFANLAVQQAVVEKVSRWIDRQIPAIREGLLAKAQAS